MGNILIIGIGLIIFAVVRQLMGYSEEGKKRQYPPVTLPEDDEEWDYDHSTFPAGKAEQQRSIKQTKKQTKKQTQRPEPPAAAPVREEPDEVREFDINSTEEVRRAIIWSEILNRKY